MILRQSRLLLPIALFLVVFSWRAQAGSGPIVALFDMEDRGSKLDQEVLINLIEYLGARLAEGGYQVVPRDQIRERLLSSKTESFKACFDQSCQIELGRELSAQKTLSTKILRIGDTCQVTSVMYDLKKATAETAATAEAACEINMLLSAVKKIAEKLCAPLQTANREADAKLAEYEELVKNAASEKAEKERAEKAWEKVLSIVKDEKVPMDKRVQVLEKYQQDFKKPNPRLDEAEKLLDDLNLATLVVRTVPEGAEVSIAGAAAGKSPVTRRMKAGTYKLVARLEGFSDSLSEAKLEAGKNLELKLTLAKQMVEKAAPLVRLQETNTTAAAAATEVEQKAPSKPLHPMKLWGHVAFWSGVGAAGLAGASAALAAKYGSDSDTIDKSKTWGGVFWASAAGAAVLMGTGVTLWLLAPDDDAPATAAALAPTLDGNGLVFSLAGRW